MADKKPTTIAEYIETAQPQAQPHLRRLYDILKSVAPEAEETIKWNMPFFVEPRFLFSFAAQKKHCNFAPSPEVIEAFSEELEGYPTTKNFLQIPYSEPVPEDLVRKLAEYRLQLVNDREGDSFW